MIDFITAGQARAARSFVRITRDELAKRAGVSPLTIKRLEDGSRVRPRMQLAIKGALERLGAVCLTDGSVQCHKPGEGPVILRNEPWRPFTGAALVAAREKAGLSSSELARAAGLTVEGVRRLERQEIVSARESTILAIIRALGQHGVRLSP